MTDIERHEICIHLARLYGYDLSILEGLTPQQLKHFADMSLKTMNRTDGKPTGAPSDDLRYDEEPVPKGEAEMPADEKVKRACAYFDKFSESLTALGYSRRSFAEAYEKAPTRLVKRLRT